MSRKKDEATLCTPELKPTDTVDACLDQSPAQIDLVEATERARIKPKGKTAQ